MLRKRSSIQGPKVKEKLFLFMLVCSGIGLLAAASALAGEYHIDDSLICAQCHTMHYSQQHDYSGAVGTGSPLSTPPQATMGGGGPYTNLLRHKANDLCLSCHNGQTIAPDVFGTNHNDDYVRQAGGLTQEGSSAGPGYDETDGHTLGKYFDHDIPGLDPETLCNNCHVFGNGVDPPRFPDRRLACVSCHEPHGVASHRNLAFPGNTPDNARVITYAKGTNVTGEDVFLRGWTEGNIGGTTSNYRIENVDFNEPGGSRGMGRFCAKCHGLFHGVVGAFNMGGTGGTN